MVSWVDFHLPPHGAPILANSTKFLAGGRYFQPTPLHVDVLIPLDKPIEALCMASMLQRLSPEEDHHAFIPATVRDLKQGRNQEVPWPMISLPLDLACLCQSFLTILQLNAQ